MPEAVALKAAFGQAADPAIEVSDSVAMQAAPRPLLIEGSRGALVGVYYAPTAAATARGDLLLVPAFAEEMNRCRAMVALAARRLAEAGIGTLVLDVFGTGDSAGEFADATWAQWRDDLARGIDWLHRHGQGCVGLWGLRLGAVMASQLARAHPEIARVLLWQPVLDGKQFLTQFLRIRIAAEMNLPNRVKSTAELRQQFAAGQAVEVSGYEIGPALAAELDGLAFDREALAGRCCAWFEVRADGEEPSFAPASARVLDALRAGGAELRAAVAGGPPFWQVHERELAPALVDATLDITTDWPIRTGPRQPAADPQGNELPVVLPCGPQWLSGVLHRAGTDRADRGAVIVVAGGPQYRAGAHRQFVQLARTLSDQGWPTLRFDLRGMGDSTGTYRGYQDSLPDLRAAVDALLAREPGLKEVVLVGECESASGILFYAYRDPRVTGVVLINPWVRTDEGRAQVIVKTYYLDRLRQPEFWSKLRRGQWDIRASFASLIEVLRAYVRGRRMFARSSVAGDGDDLDALPLPQRVATGLARFQGQTLLLMSGNDYIAREFDEVVAASRAWDGLLQSPRVRRHDVEGADHTFSRRAWKLDARAAIVDWMQRW